MMYSEQEEIEKWQGVQKILKWMKENRLELVFVSWVSIRSRSGRENPGKRFEVNINGHHYDLVVRNSGQGYYMTNVKKNRSVISSSSQSEFLKEMPKLLNSDYEIMLDEEIEQYWK